MSHANNSIQKLIESLLIFRDSPSNAHGNRQNVVGKQSAQQSATAETTLVAITKQRRPYVLLLQHSKSSFIQQQQQQQQRYDRQIQHSHWLPYTGGELWSEYIATIILESRKGVRRAHTPTEPSSRTAEKGNTNTSMVPPARILFLATLPSSTKHQSPGERMLSKYGGDSTNRVQILQIDPLATWLEESERYSYISNNNCSGCTQSVDLERLDTIITAVENYFDAAAKCTETAPCVLMMDSITPILMRHGWTKTLQFLDQLIQTVTHNNSISTISTTARDDTGGCRLVVLPIRQEMVTVQQHQQFEHVLRVDAILNVVVVAPVDDTNIHVHSHGPDTTLTNIVPPQVVVLQYATLLRRGIRERDHIRREVIPYSIRVVTDSNTNTIDPHCPTSPIGAMVHRYYQIDVPVSPINIVSTPTATARDDMHVQSTTNAATVTTAAGMSSLVITENNPMFANPPQTVGASEASSPPQQSSLRQRGGKNKVVNLQVDEGHRRRHAGSTNTDAAVVEIAPPLLQRPNIFMQDDDPEFDDYDEEDPDDDLDL
jgi:hypothetical protein